MSDQQPRAQWYSFNSYVAVTTGAIVGLGNVFQFPFLITQYGGLFLFFYFICQLFIGLPLLFAELLIGRRGMQNPVGSINTLIVESSANSRWSCLGWMCLLTAFFTICYYAVAAAFPMGYFIDNINTLTHSHFTKTDLELDTSAVSGFGQLELCFVLFLFLAMIVVYRGINRGLETISLIIVPLYCIILFALVIYIASQGYIDEGMREILKHHPEAPWKEIFLAALGLSFLKYKIGLGVLMVYGSYLPYHVPLAKSTLVVVLIDFIISLLSFFILYPLALMAGDDGSHLILSSHNVMIIFSGLPNGLIVSAFFFFAAILMVWTPLIAMGETIVITLIERLGWSRFYASTVTMIAAFILGTFVVATHMDWIDVQIVGQYPLHNLLRNITMDILAPINALLISIFAGWVMYRNTTEIELGFKPFFYTLWRFLMQYVIPIAIFLVLVTVTVLEKLPF